MATLAEQTVRFEAGPVELTGDLVVPAEAHGLVVFAHGSGSSRKSRRNRYVADQLHAGGLATFLMDLLTMEEEQVDAQSAEFRFDIPLLGERLGHAVEFVRADGRTKGLGVGLFGASTGAAAALITAAERPGNVEAVVSRGGRPDLAGEALAGVRCPTLLLVGGLDHPVIEMNRDALARMRCPKEMLIIPGATHLFEEPGTLEEVAALAVHWFKEHLH